MGEVEVNGTGSVLRFAENDAAKKMLDLLDTQAHPEMPKEEETSGSSEKVQSLASSEKIQTPPTGPAEKTLIREFVEPVATDGAPETNFSQGTYEPAAKRSRASTAASGSYMPPPPPSIGPIDTMTPSQPHPEPREDQSQQYTGIRSGKDPLEILCRYHKTGNAVGPNSWIIEGKGRFFIFLLKVYLLTRPLMMHKNTNISFRWQEHHIYSR